MSTSTPICTPGKRALLSGQRVSIAGQPIELAYPARRIFRVSRARRLLAALLRVGRVA